MNGGKDKIRKLMFGTMGSDLWKNKRGILMYGRITQEFKCLERWDKNSNVSKDKIRMLLFGIQR